MTKKLSPFASFSLRARVLVTAAALGLLGATQVDFVRRDAPNDPVLSRDWFHPLEGRYLDLGPGVPLLLPGPDNELGTRDDRLLPHIVGDIDLVVRVGTNEIVGAIPDPAPWRAAGLPVGVAEPMGQGKALDFTVVLSDGSDATPYGDRVSPPYLEGLPVLVFAFADLDDDGFIGITLLDGNAGDAEREEAELEAVGRRFALFSNGTASGQLHLEVGGPSAAPVRVALAAAMWAGPIDPDFFGGNVPKGPAVMTHIPFVPLTDPAYLVQAGAGSPDWPLPTSPNDPVGVEIEDAVQPDPEGILGEALTLRLDGSDPTIDIALMTSGQFSRFGLARAAAPDLEAQSLRLGLDDAGNPVPYDILTRFLLDDDGSASQQTLRVVPLDRLGNVTDLVGPVAVTLRAVGPVRIVSPDTDGDPTREVVSVLDERGVSLLLDDTGIAFDGANEGALILEGHGGLARFDIHLPDPDVDDSGVVDIADLLILLRAIEQDPRPPPPDLDLDGSGRLRKEDAYRVLAHLGSLAAKDSAADPVVEDHSGGTRDRNHHY